MYVTTAVHQMFAPELSEEEIKNLLEGPNMKEKNDNLIDGEVIIDEDENPFSQYPTTDMGN